jgi:hypothetical protein
MYTRIKITARKRQASDVGGRGYQTVYTPTNWALSAKADPLLGMTFPVCEKWATSYELLSSSLLGSTAQLRSWPPPQIRLNFMEASQQFSFLQGRVVSPTPNPHPAGPGLCILYPPEAGWLPILVASYDMHGLRWDYSYSPVTTRGNTKGYGGKTH